MNNFARLIMQS